MEMALIAAAAAAFIVGAAVAGTLGWIWGGARAGAGRDQREGALREAERQASAATARGDELANQARQAEGRASGLEAALRMADSERAAAVARAEELGRSVTEQRDLLEAAKAQLGDTFQALAAEALRASQQGFLSLASERLGSIRQQSASDLEARQKAIETVVGPVRESLERMDQQMRGIERERGLAYGALTAEVRALAGAHDRLRAETGNLVNALRAPAVRGRWGELQLRRVVEMAGMLE